MTLAAVTSSLTLMASPALQASNRSRRGSEGLTRRGWGEERRAAAAAAAAEEAVAVAAGGGGWGDAEEDGGRGGHAGEAAEAATVALASAGTGTLLVGGLPDMLSDFLSGSLALPPVEKMLLKSFVLQVLLLMRLKSPCERWTRWRPF